MKHIVILLIILVLNSCGTDSNKKKYSEYFGYYVEPNNIDYYEYKSNAVIFLEKEELERINMILIIDGYKIGVYKKCLDEKFLDWVIEKYKFYINKNECVGIIYNNINPIKILTCDPKTGASRNFYEFNEIKFCE